MPNTDDALFADLDATPALLRTAFAAFAASGDRATTAPAGGEWSLADLLNHLRASDAIISTRVYQVLTRDGAHLLGFDERVWGDLYKAAAIDPRAQLEQFALRRAEFVGILRALTPEQFARAGRHEERGLMTITDLCQMLADHEADHRAQIDQPPS